MAETHGIPVSSARVHTPCCFCSDQTWQPLQPGPPTTQVKPTVTPDISWASDASEVKGQWLKSRAAGHMAPACQAVAGLGVLPGGRLGVSHCALQARSHRARSQKGALSPRDTQEARLPSAHSDTWEQDGWNCHLLLLIGAADAPGTSREEGSQETG